MSFETTAKPRPDSPARAASTEPLTASMVVCTTTSEMPLTIFSILRPTASRRAIVARLARVLSRPVETPFTSLSTAPPLAFRPSPILRMRSLAWLALCCASFALFSIWASAAEVCCVAAACCWEPRLIWPMAAMIWREALDSSWMVADSSSAVALICFGGCCVDLAGAGLLGDHRQLLGGGLSLLERLGLLLDRRLGFVGGRGLLLGGAGDQQGAFFGFAGGVIGFQRAGQGFLAALGDPLHVFAQAIQHRHDGGAGLRLR